MIQSKKRPFSLGLILSAALLITTLWSGVPVTALADKNVNDFTLSDDGKTLKSYTGTSSSIVIPTGVTSIADNAFWNKTFITSVTFQNGLVSIGNNAFYGCKSLSAVSLPSTVTNISTTAFRECSNLSSITISSTAYASDNGSLYNANKTRLITVPGGKASITFPTTMTTIGANAFTGNKLITEITLPDAATTIEAGAFSDSKIAYVTIPKNVKSIGTQTGWTPTVVYGYSGSYAESYCKSAGYSFIAMDGQSAQQVFSISLDRTSLDMNVGGTYTLKATIIPSTAVTKTVVWKSLNEKVANVNSDGLVTALSIGKTTIVATTVDGFKVASCEVTVAEKAVPVTSVSLDAEKLTLQVGGAEHQMVAIVVPSNATNKEVTWTSSNTSIATVSSTGLVKAVGVGTAVITATTTDGGKKATCTVTCRKDPATAITLGAKNVTINEGGSIIIAATLTPVDSIEDIVWGSEDPDIVSVTGNKTTATIFAKTPGETQIYAKTASGLIEYCDITVASKYQPSIDELKETTGKIKTAKISGTTLKVTVAKVKIDDITVKYQIQYRVKGTANWKTVKSATLTKAINKIKKNTKYEIQVRPYAVVDSETYYGEWSKIKTV